MSLEYPKTENLFRRDEVTHKLIPGALRREHFDLVSRWHVTEKIDGTNIRLVYYPKQPTFAECPSPSMLPGHRLLRAELHVLGRSDKAVIPPGIEGHVRSLVTLDQLSAQFDEFLGEEAIVRGAHVTIYGEGYGPGIQKGGGRYAPEKRFRAFDVRYHWGETRSWCEPSTTEWICESLGIPTAPIISRGTKIDNCVHLVRAGLPSVVALMDDSSDDVEAEGIVARTDPYLYDGKGARIMFKLKAKDLA